MNVQLTVHTTGGEVTGKVTEVTEEEMFELREGIKKFSAKLDYLDLDTDTGWVIIPGSQLLYIEARILT